MRELNRASEGKCLTLIPYDVLPSIVDVVGRNEIQFDVRGKLIEIDGKKFLEVHQIRLPR